MNDPLVILIHGVGCTSRFWEDVVPLLSARHRVHAIDVPGFGDAKPLSGEVSVARLAAAIDAPLEEPEIVLIGHSLGGMIAQELAIARPDGVRGLVLCSTIPAASERVREINTDLAALVTSQGSEAFAATLGSAMLGPEMLPGTDHARDRFAHDVASADPPALANSLLAITRFDATDRLGPAIRPGTPRLVIAGAHEANLADQQALATSIDAPFALIDGAGHLAPAEAPQAFVDLVEPVLQRSRTQGSAP